VNFVLGLKAIWAQLGTAAGRKSTEPMVLSAAELPQSDWRTVRSWSFRPAIVGMADDTDRRARKRGSVWVVHYLFRAVSSQWLTVRVISMQSGADACLWVNSLESRVIRNDRAISVETHDVDRSMNGLQCVRAVRYDVTGKPKTDRKDVKCLAGSIGEVLFVVRCAGLGDGWSWNDVLSVAELQEGKIRGMLRPLKDDSV
jgi:hypothetical protein